MSKRWSFVLCGVLALVAVLSAMQAASAQTGVVYAFAGGKFGGQPASDVVFDAAGNAYVTTVVGGKFGCGTVDRLTPAPSAPWAPAVVWAFSCFFDGKNPHGGVTFDTQGNLYGTTTAGGSGGVCVGDGCGVVYRISARTHGLRVIYNFTGGKDGFGPGGRVVFDGSGNLYGTTPDGGKAGGCNGQGCGVVYQLSFHKDHWVQTVIHQFSGGNDGAVGSLGPLLVSGTSIYGVAELGGRYGAGVAYKATFANGTWTYNVIYPFKGLPDAGFPYGGLIANAKGDLFGTTYYGGTSGNGAIYELIPRPTGHYAEKVLYSFSGGSDGGNPTTTLLMDNAGNLYGTASAGGTQDCGCGVVFKLDALTGTESVLHTFGSSSVDGYAPYYALTPFNGLLYTTTNAGGLLAQGTLFGVSP